MKKNIQPFPFRVYYFSILFLVVAGLADSIYLFYSHYLNYTNIGYSSFCAISKAINCDTVSQSPYSIFLGLPVALWGALGYLFLIVLITVAGSQKRKQAELWTLIFLIGLFYSAISIILAVVSSFLIRSYCIMCILSWAINFMVFYLSWIVIRRFDKRYFAQRVRGDFGFLRKKLHVGVPVALAFFISLALLWMLMPQYWKFQMPDASVLDIKSGVTDAGYPWIGAENPKIAIIEYTDYMCFQCRKMHYFLRRLVAQYPERIRLIHRHFPLDREYNPLVGIPFHSGSGKMAIIAIYAQFKNQFWEVSDLLFQLAEQKKDFNTKTISEFMNIKPLELVSALNNKMLRIRLKHDIAVGLEMGITGTPSFVIDGNVYLGTIPADILKKVDFIDVENSTSQDPVNGRQQNDVDVK